MSRKLIRAASGLTAGEFAGSLRYLRIPVTLRPSGAYVSRHIAKKLVDALA